MSAQNLGEQPSRLFNQNRPRFRDRHAGAVTGVVPCRMSTATIVVWRQRPSIWRAAYRVHRVVDHLCFAGRLLSWSTRALDVHLQLFLNC